ncbi:collagen alpha-3(VI) chain-like [Engraulis encrasicolus]|uniref:collagen alpha-3(VI) chain-like n=1 Tax=Engraulis encrasicolus TaxID=184585 RepID=UPI002FD151C8
MSAPRVSACRILVYFAIALIQGWTVGITAQGSSPSCQDVETEVVFLFDGSKDLNNSDFLLLKNAIATYINQSSEKTFKFAAVQFSHNFKTVFTFKDYQDGRALDYLKLEVQMAAQRNTYGAMEYALNVFTTAADIAERFLIIFTRGPPDDKAEDYQHVLQAYKEKDIQTVFIKDNQPFNPPTFTIKDFRFQHVSEKLNLILGDPIEKLDVVFLFDGSLSMKTEGFNRNKDFISSFMQKQSGKFIQYAAVQFSSNVRSVFTFQDYQEGKALSSLQNEQHMKSLTNTHKALRYTLDNIFDDPTAGGRKSASKVVVLITDGNPSDSAKWEGVNILSTYEERNIGRIVIGVGSEVSSHHLQRIASVDKYTNIMDYSGLEHMHPVIFKMLLGTAKVC